MNETCTKCGGFTGDFTWSGDFSSAPICKCNNLMPPHQSEKEILDEIASVNGMHIYAGKEHYSRELDREKLASYLYKLESRLEELQRKVEAEQRIQELLRTTEYSESPDYHRGLQDAIGILNSKRK